MIIQTPVMIRRTRWSLQLVAKVGVSQGAPSEGLPGQAPFLHSSVERSPRSVCPDQLVVVFRLQLPQAEGMSGNLRRSAFLTPDVLPLPCFLSAFISFLRFAVFFSQKRGFPLKAGGSPAILAAKTWQYFLKYGCGVCFVFVVILCCIVSFCDHWRFSVGHFPLWC